MRSVSGLYLVLASIAFLFPRQHAFAQETCGLQYAKYEDPNGPKPVEGFGLGPALTTVMPPSLGVTPTVTITYPTAGSVLPLGKVQIAGTVTGSTNTGVAVNGIRAYVHNGTFLTPEIQVDGTTTNIEAQATSMDGLSVTTSVAVSVSGSAPDARIAADVPVGFAPFPVNYFASLASGLHLQSVSVDFNGDGSSDYSGTSLGYLPTYTYNLAGVYTATATFTLDNSQQIVARQRIIALDLSEQRNNLCSVYAHLRSRLLAQDVDGARNALMGGLDARLSPLFTALGSRMPTVAAQLGPLADGLIGLDSADLIAVRDRIAEVHGYPIHFARDAKGVWRIDSM
jgi:hypothetical protein